jgi:hypothetical protein
MMERESIMKQELAPKVVILMERVNFQKEVKRVIETVRSPRAPGGERRRILVLKVLSPQEVGEKVYQTLLA